jgi:hypothetical protein
MALCREKDMSYISGLRAGVRVPPEVHKDIFGVRENIFRGM